MTVSCTSSTLADREGHSATTTQTESESMLPTTSNAGASPPRGDPSDSSLMVVHCRMAEELARGSFLQRLLCSILQLLLIIMT